jgi:hypothetical protein
VDPRAGLDEMEKCKFLTLPGLEPRLLSRPARSQSLYRLRYPGSSLYLISVRIRQFQFRFQGHKIRSAADRRNPLLLPVLSVNFRKSLTRSFHCSTISTMAGRSNHDFLEQ